MLFCVIHRIVLQMKRLQTKQRLLNVCVMHSEKKGHDAVLPGVEMQSNTLFEDLLDM